MITSIRTLPMFAALALMTASAAAQDAQTAPGTAPANEPGQAFELPRVGNKDTQIELISGLCGVQMKQMSPIACTCLAEQALTTLSDPQRDYMIATVVAPPVAERMLNDGRVGQPDQQTIFAFINETSDACASGSFKPAAAVPAAPRPAVPAPAVPAAPKAAPAN